MDDPITTASDLTRVRTSVMVVAITVITGLYSFMYKAIPTAGELTCVRARVAVDAVAVITALTRLDYPVPTRRRSAVTVTAIRVPRVPVITALNPLPNKTIPAERLRTA